jgi:hypothetical protein
MYRGEGGSPEGEGRTPGVSMDSDELPSPRTVSLVEEGEGGGDYEGGSNRGWRRRGSFPDDEEEGSWSGGGAHTQGGSVSKATTRLSDRPSRSDHGSSRSDWHAVQVGGPGEPRARRERETSLDPVNFDNWSTHKGEAALHHGLDISSLNMSMQDLGFDPRELRAQLPRENFPQMASSEEMSERTSQAKCRCRRNVTCTYVTQYVNSMIAFFMGLSYLALTSPMAYDREMTTWLTLIFFTYGAGRFYMARSKQMALVDRNAAKYGQFATMEVSYFYLSNTALGGAAWVSVGLALSLVLLPDTLGFSVYIYTLMCAFAIFVAIPAMPIGAKCFPPRTPKHSIALKLFIIATVLTLSGAFLACEYVGDNDITKGDYDDMQISASSQIIYSFVLLLGPQYIPIHIAEMLSMICQIMLWQATLTIMGRSLLT